MTIKRAKLRDPHTGVATYMDIVDTDGIIAIARFMLATGEGNDRILTIVTWADSLDHRPTGKEFAAFMQSIGAKFQTVTHLIENEEN